MSKIIAQFLALLLQRLRFRNRISRIVLFGCALALAVLATAALPERANAQVFATSKDLCIGDPIYNDPNTCLPASIVGVGQQVFYVIKVTNPPTSAPQQITLTETYPTGFASGVLPGAIVCKDQTGATIPFTVTGPVTAPVIKFALQIGATVTCTIAGTFDNTAVGPRTNTVVVANEVSSQSPSVTTTVASTTQLGADLSVTKSVSPSPIGWQTNYSLPAIVTYTVTIKNNGPNAVDVGQWFVLHDTLALLPGSVSLYATVVAGSFTCAVTPPFPPPPPTTPATDCLDTTATITASTPQLIGTMAPRPMFDWSFPPGSAGHIEAGATITLTWKVKIEQLPTLSCVKSVTQNGLKNQVFFTLTNPDNTAANDINNANNTASAPLIVRINLPANPNCGDGQLTMTKTQVSPANPVAWGGPTWPPGFLGTVTYDIKITNTSMPQQTITIPGAKLEDFVIQGIGTPPFTRTFVSATCISSSPASICAGFTAGGGTPPPPAPFPSPATQFPYKFYGQQNLGWSSNPNNDLVLDAGNPGDSVTIRVRFNYFGPDCTTVPNVAPRFIHNKAQITYMATVVGAAQGDPQDVEYTQFAIASTQMKPQQPCRFVVKKTFAPSSPKTVQFGGPPLVYDVTFTNNDVARDIGTVMDAVRITDAAYATQVPFTSSWVCTETGGVTPLPISAPPVNGTAIYTNSPAQGVPVFQFTNLNFKNGAQLKCTVTITVNRPAFNNPNCSMNPAYFENAALMDVTHPFNTNVPWPPSGAYNAGALSNPTPQDKNWATLKLPLPKCYNVNINKTASVNGFSPAWTSPSGPPVNYAITVTNTGTSGALTGGVPPLLPPLWNGLRVDDVVAPPYNNNLINGASCVPGTWCTLLKPPAPPPSSPSYAGVRNLLPSGSGVWKLTLNPPFTAGQPINNCASVKPEGTFAGPDYYSNYDPANPPPPACVQVPVLTTVPLSVTKTIVNATGQTLNIPPTAFGVKVACQPWPLQSSGNLTLTFGITTLPNGGSVSATGLVQNVPVAPGETCTVTEPTLPPVPVAATVACGGKGYAYWDTTISPAQPMPITTGPNAVTVTNTLRCRPTALQVTKRTQYPAGLPIPSPQPDFPLAVTCTPPGPNTPVTLTINNTLGSQTVSDIPVGSTCTFTETIPLVSSFFPLASGCKWVPTFVVDGVPHTANPFILDIKAQPNPHKVQVLNRLICRATALELKKVVRDLNEGPAMPNPLPTFTVSVNCTPNGPNTSVTLTDGGLPQQVIDIPDFSKCIIEETVPPVPSTYPPDCKWVSTLVYGGGAPQPNPLTIGSIPPLPSTQTPHPIEVRNDFSCARRKPLPVSVRPIVCRAPMVLNAAGTACVCPEGTVQRGRACVKPPECRAPMITNAAGACVCPEGLVQRGRECVKPPECRAPMIANPAGTGCICPSGTVQRGRECVKPIECRAPMIANPAGTACVCPRGTQQKGQDCVKPLECRPPMIANPAGTACVCPRGMQQKGQDCVKPLECRAPMIANPAGTACVCPPGTQQKGQECVRAGGRDPRGER